MEFEEQPRLSEAPQRVREALVDEQIKSKHYNGLMQKVLEKERLESLEWCQCGSCDTSTIGVPRSAFCCKEVEPFLSLAPTGCFVAEADFQKSCLDVHQLVISAQTYDYAKGNIVRDSASLQKDTKALRFAAYRNCIFWAFGKLGKGHRKELPACALHAIRKAFPDPAGNYVDFKC